MEDIVAYNDNLSDFVKIFHMVLNSKHNVFDVNMRDDGKNVTQDINKKDLLKELTMFRKNISIDTCCYGYVWLTIDFSGDKVYIDFDLG